MPRHLTCIGIAGLAAAAFGFPAVALAATPSNPQVIEVNPTTGTQTVLAGGAPWTTLGGIAVGASGTVYVANQGPLGPNPQGAGLYALTPPGFTMAPVTTGGYPNGVVASGSALYSLDSDQVLSVTPGSQQVISSGGLYDSYGVQPAFGALSCSTLYTTASSSCASAESGGAYVIAVNTTTGQQTLVKNLGCASLGGIAVASDGSLLVAETTPAAIVRINPATGATNTVASGGALKVPRGIALVSYGDLVVADATSGVLELSMPGGDQSPIASGAPLGGANGVALDAAGNIYVSEAGAPPVLRASASSRQRFSSAGLRFSASCRPACTVGYDVTVRIPGSTSFSQDAAFSGVGAKRTLVVKLPAQVNRRIARALRRHSSVAVKLTATPQDARTGVAGTSARMNLRLVR